MCFVVSDAVWFWFAFVAGIRDAPGGAGVAPARGGAYFSLQRQRKAGKRKPLTPPALDLYPRALNVPGSNRGFSNDRQAPAKTYVYQLEQRLILYGLNLQRLGKSTAYRGGTSLIAGLCAS
ncbi:hypothetical protein AB4Y32_03485 [Paraburkholderia phymatum]|uniref:Uncharacterized protein n=1 Tax=Paraburkholderia phymatum TaxID=148447 RepID=A0ACC6TU27_9BURK